MTVGTDIGSPQPDENRLFEEAAEWFLRLRAADTAPAVRAQFDAWCAQHPRHAATCRAVAAAWEVVGAHATAPELLLARHNALERAGMAARQRRTGGTERRRWMVWAGNLAATAACLVLLAWVGRVWQAQGRIQTYETSVGERRALTLADNSRITLDAESRIAVAYSAEVRLVELFGGQAHFEVAKDPSRAFKVKVANETVVARGTAFNVEHRDDQVSVTLLQGHITVSQGEQVPAGVQADRPGIPHGGGTTHELAPGEQLIIRKNGQVEPRRNVSVDQVTAWQRGKIVLQKDAIADACARMNRYSRIKLRVEDQAVARLRVSGVFEAGDTTAFAEALGSLFGVRAVRVDNDSILLLPSGSGG